MMRPHSLNDETLARLQQLVAVTYSGRDDLYAAAQKLNDQELSVVCRKLAKDLGSHTPYLEQIIAMNNGIPGTREDIPAALHQEIMKFFRDGRGGSDVLSVLNQEQNKVCKQYDETIAAIPDPETPSILKQQKKDVELGKRVLAKIAKQNRKTSIIRDQPRSDRKES